MSMRRGNWLPRLVPWRVGIVCARAQLITTIPGTTWTFAPAPLPAVNAPLGYVHGVAVDPTGNVVLSDGENVNSWRWARSSAMRLLPSYGLATRLKHCWHTTQETK